MGNRVSDRKLQPSVSVNYTEVLNTAYTCLLAVVDYITMVVSISFFWSPSITDDDVFLFNVECGSCCGLGGQCVSSIVYHKVGIDKQNPELGRALEHADICDCV